MLLDPNLTKWILLLGIHTQQPSLQINQNSSENTNATFVAYRQRLGPLGLKGEGNNNSKAE